MLEMEDVTDVEIAFGTTKGLPKWEDIPDEFKAGKTTWNKFFSHIFYRGGKGVAMDFNEGVDPKKFYRWFGAHACSWDPKHEHKEAGIAFRISRWLKDWKYTEETTKESTCSNQ